MQNPAEIFPENNDKSLVSINTAVIIIIEEMTSRRFVSGEQTHSVVQE